VLTGCCAKTHVALLKSKINVQKNLTFKDLINIA
jgi:hypothetical protein